MDFIARRQRKHTEGTAEADIATAAILCLRSRHRRRRPCCRRPCRRRRRQRPQGLNSGLQSVPNYREKNERRQEGEKKKKKYKERIVPLTHKEKEAYSSPWKIEANLYSVFFFLLILDGHLWEIFPPFFLGSGLTSGNFSFSMLSDKASIVRKLRLSFKKKVNLKSYI